MKKLLFLSVVLLASCTSVPEPVENPESVTTIEILNQPRDTVEYVFLEGYIYLIEDDLVKYKTNYVTENQIVVNTIAFMVIIMILVLMIIIGFANIFE